MYIYIYIYICTLVSRSNRFATPRAGSAGTDGPDFGRGDDTVGNPHRAQIVQFELFELCVLLNLDKQFSVEQFEPTVSQSTVPSPPSYDRARTRCQAPPGLGGREDDGGRPPPGASLHRFTDYIFYCMFNMFM